jgi:hypothetical protein
MKLVVTISQEEADPLEANKTAQAPAPLNLSYAFRAAARVGQLLVEGGELSPRLKHEAEALRHQYDLQ